MKSMVGDLPAMQTTLLLENVINRCEVVKPNQTPPTHLYNYIYTTHDIHSSSIIPILPPNSQGSIKNTHTSVCSQIAFLLSLFMVSDIQVPGQRVNFEKCDIVTSQVV